VYGAFFALVGVCAALSDQVVPKVQGENATAGNAEGENVEEARAETG
jgi:hypothetical protein